MKYRKKPVVIEAIKISPEIINKELLLFCPEASLELENNNNWYLIIPTLEGEMKAKPGDYIIKGVVGEFYPCKPDIFQATYELAE